MINTKHYCINSLILKAYKIYFDSLLFSFPGDFRMYVGEDQNKVKNIVRAQMPEFRNLYIPIFKELEEYAILDTLSGMGEQDTSPPARLYHLSMLPKNLQVRASIALCFILQYVEEAVRQVTRMIFSSPRKPELDRLIYFRFVKE